MGQPTQTEPAPCPNGKHDFTDYYASGSCATPYCPGWAESHCRACGWFFTDCPCGSCNGASRQSTAQERAVQRRQLDKAFGAKEQTDGRHTA